MSTLVTLLWGLILSSTTPEVLTDSHPPLRCVPSFARDILQQSIMEEQLPVVSHVEKSK